jgi:hypothetical protein
MPATAAAPLPTLDAPCRMTYVRSARRQRITSMTERAAVGVLGITTAFILVAAPRAPERNHRRPTRSLPARHCSELWCDIRPLRTRFAIVQTAMVEGETSCHACRGAQLLARGEDPRIPRPKHLPIPLGRFILAGGRGAAGGGAGARARQAARGHLPGRLGAGAAHERPPCSRGLGLPRVPPRSSTTW